MHSDLQDVVKPSSLARRPFVISRKIFSGPFAYNTLGIPIAMGLLHLFGGPLLNPMLAG